MSLQERIASASFKTVGAKQTKKAINNGKVQVVFVARDAEARVTDPLIKLCKEKGLEIVYVDTMKELGEACKIDVGAATAGIATE
ncbi:MAG: large subunit ribosomal protein [Clostridia bacterium]|jgi:large subunit ribosomal protein L7A|nr:ribosomal protein HS6-type [Clostridiales bacterium]MDK2986151.1 large subunit ribosomal protein [Clostridia bacterium]